MSKLRNRFIEEMDLKGFTENTIDPYARAVKQLSNFYNKSPIDITDNEIRKYLLYLRREKCIAVKTYNVALYAIKCFYRLMVPDRALPKFKAIRPALKLPEVFSGYEVYKLLNAVKNLKYKTIFTIMYSAGLRVGECVKLKIEDIDGKRMAIKVDQGKGHKDRYTILSRHAQLLLRQYYKAYKPKKWLFEGNPKTKHLNKSCVQRVFQKVVKSVGIRKKSRPHTLRHSFATHLLEQKYPLPVIQRFLGHKNIHSTLVYTHVTSALITSVKSPLDTIMEHKIKRGGGHA